jgi:hypothetical protein
MPNEPINDRHVMLCMGLIRSAVFTSQPFSGEKTTMTHTATAHSAIAATAFLHLLVNLSCSKSL